jgi:hypothetical protein
MFTNSLQALLVIYCRVGTPKTQLNNPAHNLFFLQAGFLPPNVLLGLSGIYTSEWDFTDNTDKRSGVDLARGKAYSLKAIQLSDSCTWVKIYLLQLCTTAIYLLVSL